MADFRDYIEYSEKHLSLAEDTLSVQQKTGFLISAIIFSWSAMECFVNNRLDDLEAVGPESFELHEMAFLTEKKVRFIESGEDAGKFIAKGAEYRRLEDKILFLLAKSGNRLDKSNHLWQQFKIFKTVRDSLVHPRQYNEDEISGDSVKGFILISKEIIQLLSKNIWNKEISF